MEDYSKRAKEQWGQIAQYQEFEEKTKGVSDTQQKDVINRFMLIFTEFVKIKELDTSCDTVQLQVKKLQDFITENYYTCTKEILSGPGKMYASGGEFTENIDSYCGEGTALFTAKAIEIYCK